MTTIVNYIDYIFFSIYELIGNVQRGYASETKMRRVLLSIYLFALQIDLLIFGIFNANHQRAYMLPLWFVITVFLYLLFGYKKRYLTMEQKYTDSSNRPLYGGFIAFLFFVGCVSFYVWRNQ